MKNITLKIDAEIHRKARIRAANNGMSLSVMARAYLIVFASAPEADAR